MPTRDELFRAAMELDPEHGAMFRAMRLRPPELVKLSVIETAIYMERTVRTIRRWQAEGKMPPQIKVGREKRYRLLDVRQLKLAIASGAVRQV